MAEAKFPVSGLPSAVSVFVNWHTGRLFRIYLQGAGSDTAPIMFLRGIGASVLAQSGGQRTTVQDLT
jgi:hypothetical protein